VGWPRAHPRLLDSCVLAGSVLGLGFQGPPYYVPVMVYSLVIARGDAGGGGRGAVGARRITSSGDRRVRQCCRCRTRWNLCCPGVKAILAELVAREVSPVLVPLTPRRGLVTGRRPFDGSSSHLLPFSDRELACTRVTRGTFRPSMSRAFPPVGDGSMDSRATNSNAGLAEETSPVIRIPAAEDHGLAGVCPGALPGGGLGSRPPCGTWAEPQTPGTRQGTRHSRAGAQPRTPDAAQWPGDRPGPEIEMSASSDPPCRPGAAGSRLVIRSTSAAAREAGGGPPCGFCARRSPVHEDHGEDSPRQSRRSGAGIPCSKHAGESRSSPCRMAP
jgi:hypothetical protein